MKWIELIIVRAMDIRHKPMLKQLGDQLTPNRRPPGLHAVTLYRNAFVENDICVHMRWEQQANQPTRSDVGIELAAALDDFGRVHHTIWIQE